MNTDKMFSEYKDKRCVITGGAGFIGSALRKRLIELGARTQCLDIQDHYVQNINVVDRLALEFKHLPDYVFHLAALTEIEKSYEYPAEYYKTNVLGTANILEMCRLTKTVKKVVCASSDKAYGERAESTLPYRETDTLLPSLDPYGNSKRLMDELCGDYRRIYGLPVRVLRSANTYGPGQRNQTTLITNTILRLMRGECAITHHGTMLKDKEWLYIDDAVNAYLLAGLCDINCGGVWNVGSGYYCSPISIIKEIMSIMGINKPIEVIDSGVKRVGTQRLDTRLYSSILNAALLIGEQYAFTDLESGLVKTIEWYRREYGNHTSYADSTSLHT